MDGNWSLSSKVDHEYSRGSTERILLQEETRKWEGRLEARRKLKCVKNSVCPRVLGSTQEHYTYLSIRCEWHCDF
jgi:hypothetical protein